MKSKSAIAAILIAACMTTLSVSAAELDSGKVNQRKDTQSNQKPQNTSNMVAALVSVPTTAEQERNRDNTSYKRVVATWSPERQAQEKKDAEMLIAIAAAKKAKGGK